MTAKAPSSHGALESPVQYLKGVGPKKAALFEKLGVRSIRDILYHFPARYEDRSRMMKISQTETGALVTIKAYVRSTSSRQGRGRGRRVFEVAFADETGFIRATWFNFSAKALEARFKPGTEWVVSGRVEINKYSGAKTIFHPDTEKYEGEGAEETLGRILPIYPATEGLNQKAIRSATLAAMDLADGLIDFVPDRLNKKYHLPSLADSVRTVHWPGPDIAFSDLESVMTREQKKLVFSEFFLAQTGLALKRRGMSKEAEGVAMDVGEELTGKIIGLFPFTLTSAQGRALGEIAKDMGSSRPMRRLLQGDVGSGKTVIALAAALIAIRNRKQAAVMVPTEILAAQHYRKISALLEGTKVEIVLLTSGVSGKKEIMERIKQGHSHIIIGTHALIQEQVGFHSLGMVVIDEQHRFGVNQRAELMRKGDNPHTLIMTATPIPRTLAMTLYGDLDVSVIDEAPPGRKPVITRLHGPQGRGSAIGLIRQEAAKGRQAFIVYPLVEESEKLELKAAKEMFEHLKEGDLAGFRLGLTHGRMKSAEKDEVMELFAKGELDVLVSTTVIEVGVDVPNATVMMIEHAERFGLSQLHQLRGRVGRGQGGSHCLLMAETYPGSPAWERLKVMEKSNDGFYIAEADLSMRGSGEVFGERQSGLPEFKIGNILRDYKILAEARKAAFELVEEDPELELPQNACLRWAVKEAWRDKFELGSVG